MPKRSTVVKVSALLSGAALLSALATYANAALRAVQFEADSVDVGVVREGQEVRALFRFRNDGASTARIVRVEPSCGVSASPFDGRDVLRGEDGELEVRIGTSGRQGAISGVVAVTLADPLQRTLLLTVRATIEREFVLETPLLDFGTIAHEPPRRRQLNVRLHNTNHEVLNAVSTDEHFEAHVVRSDPENGIATILVDAQRLTPGLKFGTIRITTTSPHMPLLIVPVRASVAGQL